MSDPISNIEGDIRVNGTLSCDGDLIIDGQLEGELSVKGHLTITEIGNVGADTEASKLTVAGLSLIHISEHTRRYAISYADF